MVSARTAKKPAEVQVFLNAVRSVGRAVVLSTSTKTFSSKSFVWSPARLFSLLRKYDSAVRFLHVTEAVQSLKRTIIKTLIS
jgi:hypothetical protein